jgi:hypothetical protein
MEIAALSLTALKNYTFSLGPMTKFMANPLLPAHGGPLYPLQSASITSPSIEQPPAALVRDYIHMAQKVNATQRPSRRFIRADRERRLFNPAVYEDIRGLSVSSSSVTKADAQGAGLSRPPP